MIDTKFSEDEIDNLRAGIEAEIRFKSAFQGYDKKAVADYISELHASHASELSKLREDAQKLQDENRELLSRLEVKSGDEEVIRKDERNKLKYEFDMQEGLVARLREANQELEAENHDLVIETARLKAMLAENVERIQEGNKELVALNARLNELMDEHYRQAMETVSAWQKQCDETISSIEERINILV